MLFDQTLFNVILVAALLGLWGVVAAVVGIAKARTRYSWSYSPSRRRY